MRALQRGQLLTKDVLLQLMFANPEDPPSVIAARNLERQHMRKWIETAVSKRQASTAAAR